MPGTANPYVVLKKDKANNNNNNNRVFYAIFRPANVR